MMGCGTFQLWTDETPLATLRTNALVTSVSFSPDGKILASSSDDGTIRLWKTDGTLKATLPERHKNWVTTVSFSPDGNIIASGGDYFDPTIKLWKLDGTLKATLKGHTKDINSISFSPDGTRIASASNDQTIKLWKSERGKWNYYNTLTGHSDRVTAEKLGCGCATPNIFQDKR